MLLERDLGRQALAIAANSLSQIKFLNPGSALRRPESRVRTGEPFDNRSLSRRVSFRNIDVSKLAGVVPPKTHEVIQHDKLKRDI